MRIAYLTNQYPMVSHTFIRREILELERQGAQVDRFALRGWDAEIVDPQDRIERGKTRYTLKDGALPLARNVLRCLGRNPGEFWQALKAAMSMSRKSIRPWPYHLVYLAQACRIRDWLRDSPADHLHAHFGTNPAEIALLVHLLGGPGYSFTIHGMDEVDNARQLAFDRKVGQARFVATISAYTRSQLMRHVLPGLWPKIKVVHCGLSAEAFTDAPQPQSGAPDFLCIGRLSPEKGHLILLEAFAAVLKECPEARLVLAGDGPLRDQIEARLDGLGIREAVRITGWIPSDRIFKEIAACHTLVQPSFIEGLPVVIMEAMAQGRPVISTYVAGIPELVIPGQTGWLVPAGDEGDLAAAMRESLATSAAGRAQMGRQALTRVRARHSIETEVEKLRAYFAAGDEA